MIGILKTYTEFKETSTLQNSRISKSYMNELRKTVTEISKIQIHQKHCKIEK